MTNNIATDGEEMFQTDSEVYFGVGGIDAFSTNAETAIVRLDNIHKTYLLGVEGVPALRGVSMDVKRGEFLCIFGTSGGGKTTMLNIIGTVDKPTKGSLTICGQRIGPNTEDAVTAHLRLLNIGFVFQTFNLISSLSAVENVELPMILAGELSASARRERAIALLSRVGMQDRLDHKPAQLSGGEQQRVTIARAIANQPDILLLDEPTGDLDTVNSAIVMDLLLDLRKTEGITLVMVTHDVGMKWFSDRVIWMRDGKIKTVEIVPDHKRQEVIAQLNEDLKQIHEKQEQHQLREITITPDNDDRQLSNGSETLEFLNTCVRKPTDYETHVHYDPAKHHAKMTSFLSSKESNAQLASSSKQSTLIQRDDIEQQSTFHHSS
eukprot:CAMPEP_0201555988 /NCGR_PEP_ID=MMETSP0173_2-20130828/52575_1 /ASSEMBLY_ACC=CAM_ASM_000268 /TAXON_ID=218659 /ORGANISM="Vexillifera sp., Strain DIVA3 564/2" /LENGTH=378 /DNA_ID=CAMNT_0047968039 /DNA_START=134 /DNA_END=1266 /DNA_ORIENTATION=-